MLENVVRNAVNDVADVAASRTDHPAIAKFIDALRLKRHAAIGNVHIKGLEPLPVERVKRFAKEVAELHVANGDVVHVLGANTPPVVILAQTGVPDVIRCQRRAVSVHRAAFDDRAFGTGNKLKDAPMRIKCGCGIGWNALL